jgi:hypothetical protein
MNTSLSSIHIAVIDPQRVHDTLFMKPRHIPLQCLQVLDGMVLGASEEI